MRRLLVTYICFTSDSPHHCLFVQNNGATRVYSVPSFSLYISLFSHTHRRKKKWERGTSWYLGVYKLCLNRSHFTNRHMLKVIQRVKQILWKDSRFQSVQETIFLTPPSQPYSSYWTRQEGRLGSSPNLQILFCTEREQDHNTKKYI